MRVIFILASLVLSTAAARASEQGGLPFCKAEMNDWVNQPISKSEWREKTYISSISGDGLVVLISTSLGHDKVMSLWVREKREKDPAGSFSFLNLSSGHDQYVRFYMANGYSVGVTCRWDPDSSNISHQIKE